MAPSRALREVTGCDRTYVVRFAEAEGFAHVRCPVVPRMPGPAAELRGPGIFPYLRRPAPEQVGDERADRIARQPRARLGG